jgi:cystathionine beta-lyase/cystathionine gamma-synthase
LKLETTARFNTRCIHAGQEPDSATGAIITPIYQTSTFVHDELGQDKGFDYSRTNNPTRAAVEANIAALEGARSGIAFASGVAAINAVASRLDPGDHVVVDKNIYGGTHRLFEHVLRRYKISFSYVETAIPDNVTAALTSHSKMIYVETPSNPLLGLTDLAVMADLAHSHNTKLVVDNTFASPYVQRPLEHGADLVIHSTTKYLNGHSDSIGGMVLTSNAEDEASLRFIQNTGGAIMGPFDAWLLLRGTKTLALRMRTHSQNGLALAEFLSSHSKVHEVLYPGLPDHPQHALACRQMHGFSGMLSFDVGSLEAATTVCNRARLFSLAVSLGGVESLISHPASMSHASVPRKERLERGIGDGLIRISTGIEDIQDLTEDMHQALDAI